MFLNSYSYDCSDTQQMSVNNYTMYEYLVIGGQLITYYFKC